MTRLFDVPLVAGQLRAPRHRRDPAYFLAWEVPRRSKTLRMMPIDDRRLLETIAGGVDRFELSHDRSTLLLEKGEASSRVAADGIVPLDRPEAGWCPATGPSPCSRIDEWRHIFVDAWRQQRDGF